MEEYIQILLEQVRFYQAHKGIEDEIRAHMEDQIEANMAAGMDREAAEKAAVADMGDPVEAGVSMDRVHRPRIAWNVVIIAVLVGIVSSVIHEFVAIDAGHLDQSTSVLGSHVFYIKVLIGLAAMITVYLIDYTVIAKNAKVITLMIMAILPLSYLGYTYNGVHTFLRLGPIAILTSACLLFYVPLYGAIVYKYRGGGWLAFIGALLWMFVPAILVFKRIRLLTALVMIMAMAVQLTIAVAKGWFKVPKKLTICSLWASITVVPLGIVAFLYHNGLLAGYQMNRISAIWDLDNDAAYVTRTVRSLGNVNLVGNTGKDVLGSLPSPNGDFLLTYLGNRYGLLFVAAVVAAVAAVIITGCIATAKCKNQLGFVMGVGCMDVLLVNMLVNVLENMAVIPYTGSFMPFFSAGSSNLFLSYTFLGIILSIYKYKDAYPQHVDIGIRGRIKFGDIEIMKN